MRKCLLAVAAVVVVLSGGWFGPLPLADDEPPAAAPGAEDGLNRLEFPDEGIIVRPDGTLLFFYATNFIPPQDLAARLRELSLVPGVRHHVLERSNALVMEGEPEAVEQALEAAAYFDTAPLQVLVEAQVIEITKTSDQRALLRTAEAPASVPGDAPSGEPPIVEVLGTEATGVVLSGEALERLAIDGTEEVLFKPSVLATQGVFAEVSSTQERPILRVQSTDGNTTRRSSALQSTQVRLRVLPTHIGERFATLRVELSVRDLREARVLRRETLDPASATWNVDATVTVASGEELVIGGLEARSSSGREAKPPILLRFPFSDRSAPSASQSRTETEIAVLLKATIVRRPTTMKVLSPPEDAAEPSR